ncbi:MAG: class I SAM-dependent methyltransferase [Cellulophaga sp.]
MKFYLNSKDYSVSKEEFKLVMDTDLEMLVTEPQPKDLAAYYESDVYISHTDSNKTLVDKIYQKVKKYSLRKKVGLLNSNVKKNRTLLDVGAGTGDFLSVAKQNGWKVTGVEPNEKAREKATEKGIRLYADFNSLPNTKFQVITLWHVLEHLPDLENQIKILKFFLEDDGILIIAVPNYKCYDAKHYKNFWAAYDVPRHLWHFSSVSIKRLFAKENMKVVETKPMLFDSFYVSLLSEKYKTGKQNFVKAFFIGLSSNISAWRTKEYSSHIYVLKNI